MRRAMTSIKHFWTHVKVSEPENPSSCWEWIGGCDTNFYPIYNGVTARRIAAIIWKQRDVGTVKLACRNTKCVNPHHMTHIGLPRSITFDGRSPLTGKKLKTPVQYDKPLIDLILSKRNGAYTIAKIAKECNATHKTVRLALRCATVHDILADIEKYKRNGMDVPIEPDNRTTSAFRDSK